MSWLHSNEEIFEKELESEKRRKELEQTIQSLRKEIRDLKKAIIKVCCSLFLNSFQFSMLHACTGKRNLVSEFLQKNFNGQKYNQVVNNINLIPTFLCLVIASFYEAKECYGWLFIQKCQCFNKIIPIQVEQLVN